MEVVNVQLDYTPMDFWLAKVGISNIYIFFYLFFNDKK